MPATSAGMTIKQQRSPEWQQPQIPVRNRAITTRIATCIAPCIATAKKYGCVRPLIRFLSGSCFLQFQTDEDVHREQKAEPLDRHQCHQTSVAATQA